MRGDTNFKGLKDSSDPSVYFYSVLTHINVPDVKNSSGNIVNCAIESSKRVQKTRLLPLRDEEVVVLEHFESEFYTGNLVAV